MKRTIKRLFVFLANTITLYILMSINSFALPRGGIPAETKDNFMDSLKPFFKEYHFMLSSFIAFVIITNFLIFIYHFLKLAAKSSDHPMIRKQVINDMIISGVCLMLTGGAGTIYVILFTIMTK